MGVRENRSKSVGDSSAMLPPRGLDVHLFPTKNGPGPGQPKYSDRESGTLTSRRIVLRPRPPCFLIFPFFIGRKSRPGTHTPLPSFLTVRNRFFKGESLATVRNADATVGYPVSIGCNADITNRLICPQRDSEFWNI